MQTLLYFLVWAGLIFFMMRFGCGAHVMGHGHGHHGSHSGNDPASTDKKIGWTPPDKDVDPVCGMTVATATAKSAVHDGRVYYFHSQDCREKFESSPASFLKASVLPTQSMEHGHESHH